MRLAAPAADEARHVYREVWCWSPRKTRTGHCHHIMIKVQIQNYDTVACFTKFEIISDSTRLVDTMVFKQVLKTTRSLAVDAVGECVQYVRFCHFFFKMLMGLLPAHDKEFSYVFLMVLNNVLQLLYNDDLVKL